MNNACRKCFMDKNYEKVPAGIPEDARKRYQKALRDVLADPDPALTAPEMAGRVRKVRKEYLGEDPKDFTQIKRYFNDLMLRFVPGLEEKIASAGDPLRLAVQYSMTGNFIDFVALENVEEEKLLSLLGSAPQIPIDTGTLEAFRGELLRASSVTFLTDNCGEIVMDRLLIGEILRMNPDAEVTVIVRGGPVVNDASMEDACQAGLTEMPPRVRCIGNGAPVEGTVFRFLSEEARERITLADVVVAKGQGNYETMSGCGFNVFYLFMCKCELFMKRFGVPQFSGILTRDEPAHFLQEAADGVLAQKYLFRQVLPEEAVQAGEIERICFPPNEACSMQHMRERVCAAPEQFLIAADSRSGRIAGFLTGIVTKERVFRDSFFTDASLHDPSGDTIMLTGLEVLPAYRGEGLARELVRLYGIWEAYRGRKRLVLTCLEDKVSMYEKMGFTDLGLSASAWGGETWHEMDRYLTQENRQFT